MNKTFMPRSNKRKKRRRINQMIYIMFILAFLLLISLILLIIKNNTSLNEETVSEIEEENYEHEEIVVTESKDEIKEDSDKEPIDEKHEEDVAAYFVEYVEPSDENVLEAYIRPWEPIGTNQEEPHTIDTNEKSDDYKEIMKAIARETHLKQNELIEWAIDQEDDKSVITTVSDKDEEQILRIYLTWITEKGWKITKVEELFENDKK